MSARYDQRVIFPSAARGSGTHNSPDFSARGSCWKGVQLYLDITAVSGTTPTLDIKVQAKDPLSGKYVDIPGAAFAQKSAVGTDILVIHPEVSPLANSRVSHPLPETLRVVATVGGTTPSFTFSLHGEFFVEE